MKSLDDMLKTVEAPEPSNTLKARILREAKSQRTTEKTTQKPLRAANDNRWKKWSAIAATLLVLCAVSFTMLSPNQDATETELWAETAEDLGYEDLYAWVNEEDYVEKQEQSSLTPKSIPA